MQFSSNHTDFDTFPFIRTALNSHILTRNGHELRHKPKFEFLFCFLKARFMVRELMSCDWARNEPPMDLHVHGSLCNLC